MLIYPSLSSYRISSIPARTPTDGTDNIEAVGRSRCISSSREIEEDNAYLIKIIESDRLRIMDLIGYSQNLIFSIHSFANNWRSATAEEPPSKVSKVKSSLLR